MQNLNPPKSNSTSGTPIMCIKTGSPVLIPGLTKLFNVAIVQGSFPSLLKTAAIIPLYKSGLKNYCSNCRPLFLLSSFSKIFEKFSYDQLYHFFESNKLLYDHQFGFRENLSTQLAVGQIYENFGLSLERNEIILCF